MRYSKDRDIDGTVKELIKQGWRFYQGRKHGRIKHPRGQATITIPKTPSDHRSAINFSSQVRRLERQM